MSTRSPWLRSGRTPTAPAAQVSILAIALTLDAHCFRVVDDVAADDSEHRANAFQLFGGHGEVVLIEHNEVGKLADLDTAQIFLLADEPPVRARVEVERFLAGDLLIGIDLLPTRVEPGGGVVHMDPR